MMSSPPLASPASRIAAFATGMTLVVAVAPVSLGAATHRTANFEVSAGSDSTARLIARQAEELRSSLSQEWLGEKLPTWPQRCAVRVDTTRERLAGDTTYTLVPGRVTRWQMVLNGPVERILETLLPHEILHTILASHFKDAVPRWADEGAALSVEAEADRRRLWAQEGPRLLRGPWQPLQQMFDAESYPEDRGDLRAFYAQGAVLTEFLLLAGKSRFLEFVHTGMQDGWEPAITAHYGFSGVAALEAAWVDWLRNDRPKITLAADGQTLADAVDQTRPRQNLAVAGNPRSSNVLPANDVPLQGGASGVNRFGSP
jgi:hypothetical protein